MTRLFQLGLFQLASGRMSKFKIDCDALTPDDWDCLAVLLLDLVAPFSEVHGVPTGGLAFADALRPHVDPGSSFVLVVDDVWTTGGSMREFIHDNIEIFGGGRLIQRAVVFARAATSSDVQAIFTMAV